MRHVHIRLSVPGHSARETFDRLADFSRYPELAEAVRSVVVSEVGDGVTVSQWEVTFRSGLLRWTEEDRLDAESCRIEFRQLDGDVALFDGTWQCSDSGAGTTLDFAARLDMGIPTLADALEPIAARTLVDNTVAIARGLFGDGVVVEDATHAAPVPA